MSKKSRVYAPLKLLQNRKEDEIGYQFAKRFFTEYSRGMDPLCGISEETFVDWCLSDDFLWPEYTGPCKYANRMMIKLAPRIMKGIYNMSEKEMLKNPVTVATELRDILLINTFLERWAEYKLSFRPDKDFIDALAGAKRLRINKYNFEHLPANNFYIDLTDLDDCGSIHGMFVSVLPKEEQVNIVMYLITDELTLFSYYGKGAYDDEGFLNINFEGRQLAGYEVSPSTLVSMKEKGKLDNCYRDRTFMAIIGYQMIAYLSSKEPDIEESKVSKKNYHPRKEGALPKNKFSEVQSFDVGVRFGSAFRVKKAQRGIDEYTSEAFSGRKSPIPHLRSAHWQHYHVGAERGEVVLKWIEPCFVGACKSETVVIKKVRKEKEESK